MKIQRQQEEQARQAAEMKRQQEEAERQRQEQIQRQEMERQQQEMMMQQQSMSQKVTSSQISSSSSTTKSGGFAVESRQPEPLLSESQLAQPPMSSSSLFESSQSQSLSQQSSSIQQSSSSYSQSQASKEVYESQEFSGGVMKGYRMKQDQATEQRETGEKMLSSGVFGGIGADNNALVDADFDYKKHTVKDLAKHFALVKPKADIPHAILPEQRMYNGDQGPALNYLGSAKSESSSSTQSFMKKEISQEDFEASKQAYEMKKKQQQMESQSASSQSTVVKRTETSAKSEQTKTVLNERRQSLTASLMLDPATAHAESGIIDPSAILRGETITHWKSSDPSPSHTSLRAISSSPSSQMYISKPSGPRTFAPVKFNTLPRKSKPQASLPPIHSKPVQNESSNQQKLSQSHVSNMNTSTETHLTPSSLPVHQNPILPPSSPNQMHQQPILPPSSPNPMQQKQRLAPSSPNPIPQRIIVTSPSPNPMQQSFLDSNSPNLTQRPLSTPINPNQPISNTFLAPQPDPCQTTSNISQFQSKTFDSSSSLHSNSVIQTPTAAVSNTTFLSPNIIQSPSQDMVPEYQCTVQTSSKQFAPTPTPVIILDQTNLENMSPNIPVANSQTQVQVGRPASQTNTHTSQAVHKTSVIQTMLKNTSGLTELGLDEMAVSLSFPEVSRSSNATPAPTTPFPSLDSHTTLHIPPSPIPSMRPKTPILVTTRPSSVNLDRTRHVSKDDIARMMAELNSPLPPMLQIPQEIRASPLIFSGGPAAVSHPSSLSMTQTSSSSFAMNSTTTHTFQR